jgi:hypothetical protein
VSDKYRRRCSTQPVSRPQRPKGAVHEGERDLSRVPRPEMGRRIDPSTPAVPRRKLSKIPRSSNWPSRSRVAEERAFGSVNSCGDFALSLPTNSTGAEPIGAPDAGESLPYLLPPAASDFLKSLGIPRTPQTMRKDRCVGGGPKFVRFGTQILYREDWLREWVLTRMSPPMASTSQAAEPVATKPRSNARRAAARPEMQTAGSSRARR